MPELLEDEWAERIRAVIDAAIADGHDVHLFGEYGHDAELVVGGTTVDSSRTLHEKGRE